MLIKASPRWSSTGWRLCPIHHVYKRQTQTSSDFHLRRIVTNVRGRGLSISWHWSQFCAWIVIWWYRLISHCKKSDLYRIYDHMLKWPKSELKKKSYSMWLVPFMLSWYICANGTWATFDMQTEHNLDGLNGHWWIMIIMKNFFFHSDY